MVDTNASSVHDQYDENHWTKLYRTLLPVVQFWVYNSGVLAWQGQETDVAWDIVLVAVSKTFERIQNTSRPPIDSPESFSFRIAHNNFIDRVRHEKHLTVQSFSQLPALSNEAKRLGDQTILDTLVDPSEDAFEVVYEEQVLVRAVWHISRFPSKQRDALLNDLANRMHFDNEPSVLQLAFLKQGIQIQLYRRPLPSNRVKRSSRASSLSYAYKRLSTLDFDDLDPNEPQSKRQK